jgi:hypothetical protein
LPISRTTELSLDVTDFNSCWRMRENEGARPRITPTMQVGVNDTLWTIETPYELLISGG